MKITPSNMRKRFHMATAEAEAIRAKSAPLRAARDAIIAETQPKLRDLEKQIKAIELGLGELEAERGTIAKAMREEDGKSRLGKPEEYCTAEELAKARG